MIQLLLAILFFLLSLLCIFPAPEYHLWYVSILTTEFPWIFILILLPFFFWVNKAKKFRIISLSTSAVALVLFLSPIVRAFSVSANLRQELQTALGAPGDSETERPFSMLRMFSGIGEPELPYQTFIYSNPENKALTLDYYHSQVTGIRPCVIVIHGGSWAGGDSRQLPELNTVLAEHGYNVAAISYRLAPKHIYPAQIEDIKAAINYLRRNALELEVDTTQFVLLGRSAGAQLAMDAAYNFNDAGIRGAINFYGPADMVWGYLNPANPLVIDSKSVMEDFLGGTSEEVPENYRHSSATYAVTRSTVPTLTIHGKNDPLVAYEHAVRLNDSLERKGIPHYLLSLPWATHGCDYTLNGPSGQLTTYSVLYFLESVFPQGED